MNEPNLCVFPPPLSFKSFPATASAPSAPVAQVKVFSQLVSGLRDQRFHGKPSGWRRCRTGPSILRWTFSGIGFYTVAVCNFVNLRPLLLGLLDIAPRALSVGPFFALQKGGRERFKEFRARNILT